MIRRLVPDKKFLVPSPLPGHKPRVVRERLNAILAQPGGDTLGPSFRLWQ